jgi:hypothetical protein
MALVEFSSSISVSGSCQSSASCARDCKHTGSSALAGGRLLETFIVVILVGPDHLGCLGLRTALATCEFVCQISVLRSREMRYHTGSLLGRRRRSIGGLLLESVDFLVESGPLILEALHGAAFHGDLVPVDRLALRLQLSDDAEKELILGIAVNISQ